jgi:hypothetical protein
MSHARTIAASVSLGERVEPAAGLCRWCGGAVVKPRRTFCSGEAARFVKRWLPGKTKRVRAIVDGTGTGCVHEFLIRSRPGYARKCVDARDHGVCALCGASGGEWQADHIVPVIEGGGLVGLEGLRALCAVCHRTETAKLATRRARARAGLLDEAGESTP